MLNQIQIVPMHDLSPLLTHPDFHQGATDAQECFLADYAPEPLTEGEMIYEIEICAGRYGVELDKKTEWSAPYFYWLGYAYGIINEGLSYKASPSADSDSDHSDLSALLTHPDFLQGASWAQDSFLDIYEPAPLTEDEMITEVEDNLGRANTQRSSVAVKAFGGRQASYIYHLGFVYGLINEGLTYSYTIG